MKLSVLTARSIFTVAFISIILAFIISILFQYHNFQNDIKDIKDEFIELKKEEIKREVLKVHNFIQYKESLIIKNIKQKLTNRVNTAHTIATSIYNKYKDIKSDKEIKQLIVIALKDISYSENRAYYFINSNTGKAVLFNKKSTLNQNKSVWNLKDVNGHYIVRKQAILAKEKGTAFVKNYFIKPDLNNGIQYPKLTIVKNFKPYDWHIGTGEYIDDMVGKIKEEVLKSIATIRFGQDGYIFVNSLEKKALVYDGKMLEAPKNYTNEEIYNKQLNAIKNVNGDFFFYSFKKLNTIETYPKLAFVKEYDKWNWIIGSGVYIDNIETQLAKKKEKLIETISSQISTFLTTLLALLVIIYVISRKLSKFLDNNINNLIKSFRIASDNYEEMDTEKLTYNEFKSLGKSLNKTLKSRNETEKKLQDYINIVNENVIISRTDKDGHIIDASEAFCKVSGYSKKELLGSSHNIVRHPDTPKEFYEEMWNKLTKGLPWAGEIKNKNKNGETYWVDTIIQAEFENDKISGYTAVRQDITNRKKVEYLSITDELTKLYNRRYFNKVIDDEINRAKRDNHYLSFIMIDIDYFKKYNDTYGHQSGDNTLQAISNLLISDTNRISDFAFRLGGEEFGIIFSAQDKAKAFIFADKIRKDIEELHIEHKSSDVSDYVTVSVGLIAKKGTDISTSSEIYRLADEALYKAKESGRNNVQES